MISLNSSLIFNSVIPSSSIWNHWGPLAWLDHFGAGCLGARDSVPMTFSFLSHKKDSSPQIIVRMNGGQVHKSNLSVTSHSSLCAHTSAT
jgi:hypothetical protein